ncbi:MAG: GNAT family N-acetyltransferase [Deltaproteobacteria bacterium]|jgi:ribosomal protein S18 acetylase RimI-like enzyme|nr:GNAT family N-acetyltransferase [Deltaproteobacteria bacterium]
MNLRVVDADLADSLHADALVSILDSYARGPGGQNQALSSFARESLVGGLAEHPSATVLLALIDEQPVGTAVCIWGFSTFAGRPSVNIHDLAVLPTRQRLGAGRELIAEVERRAKAKGCAKITLEVHDTNEEAKRLYRSLGFGPWESPTLFVSKPLA